jgi:hypothetical protein
MATLIAGGASISKQCNPKMPGASRFSKTSRYRVQSTLAQQQQFFVAAQPTRTCPERTKDCCCHCPSKTSFKQGRKCLCRRGLGRSSKNLNRRSCPTTPREGVIDRMLQGSIIGSVGPLHGPDWQRSHASAGQPDRPEGEDQLGPTTSHLGQCCRRTFRRTRRTNQMSRCSTNSLRRRRRYHRLPGIHRRRHSDRRAATLRLSGPVSGPVAGLA